jgi:hypothetical protein
MLLGLLWAEKNEKGNTDEVRLYQEVSGCIRLYQMKHQGKDRGQRPNGR